MIHSTWRITTVAFLAVGVALILSSTTLHGDARRAMALLAAGFAGLALWLGFAYMRSLLRHPGPH